MDPGIRESDGNEKRGGMGVCSSDGSLIAVEMIAVLLLVVIVVVMVVFVMMVVGYKVVVVMKVTTAACVRSTW